MINSALNRVYVEIHDRGEIFSKYIELIIACKITPNIKSIYNIYIKKIYP